jgi:hypothetical protein
MNTEHKKKSGYKKNDLLWEEEKPKIMLCPTLNKHMPIY